jgi:protocatechuate 3,4-dioxygenase beta subunit
VKYVYLSFVFVTLRALVIAQAHDAAIQKVENELRAKQKSVNEILGDTSLLYLHDQTQFRMVIEKYAQPGVLKIIADSEPGAKISVKGLVTSKTGEGIPNAMIYVYQTSTLGWYSDTAAHILMNQGDRLHARLFGYARSNEDGRFELVTIKPHGYPKSDLPAHIHFEVTAPGRGSAITELLFDDDPRLVGTVRSNALSEGFIVAKNSGTGVQPIYVYTITLY